MEEKAKNHAPASTGTIYERIIAAMREVEAVAKNKKNQEQGYSYRSAEDIMNALHPVLAKHGIFIMTYAEEITQTEGATAKGTKYTQTSMKIRFSFVSDAGEKLDILVPAQARDYGDMGYYKCMTMALKYMLAITFCVPFVKLQNAEDGEQIVAKNDDQESSPSEIVTDADIESAIMESKSKNSMMPLVNIWNKMTPDQQKTKNAILSQTRKEIEDMRKTNTPAKVEAPVVDSPKVETPAKVEEPVVQEKNIVTETKEGPKKPGIVKPGV